MKAALTASLLLLLLSVSVFGHGVERGSIWSGIASSELGPLSEATKQEISQTIESRCELSGLVSASAEFAGSEDSISAGNYDGIRIRILVKIENKALPEKIIVIATRKRFPLADDSSKMDYLISSPICR
jgi:hypothetical protein